MLIQANVYPLKYAIFILKYGHQVIKRAGHKRRSIRVKTDYGPGPREMEKPKTFDYSFKLLLLGNQSVGKTCILQRYLDDVFTSTEKATIGRN